MKAAPFLALAQLAIPTYAVTTYELVKQYQGNTFFDDWTFYNKIDDLTHGYVTYVSAKTAQSAQLGYVNNAGNAIMRVDNTTRLQLNDKRNSVRIATKDRYAIGSVWVADMLHVPYGCSVWPAWWSSAKVWPEGGEIDTFEGVNNVTMNQMGLHTDPGCSQVSPVQTSTLINTTDCSNLANSNAGCDTTNPTTLSYGAPFAQAGGGVWVTEFASSGISIWFFTRANVPAALTGNASTIDTSAFGTPVGNWPTGGCNIEAYFEPQELIFDITLCGDYAGNPATFSQTCSGFCYDDYVISDPSYYSTAYFEVQYVRVYGLEGQNVVVSAASARTNGGFALIGAVGFLTYVIMLAAW